MSVVLAAQLFNKLTASSLRKGVRGFVLGNRVVVETAYGYLSCLGEGTDDESFEFESLYASELVNTPPQIIPDERTLVTLTKQTIATVMGGLLRTFPVTSRECTSEQVLPSPLDGDSFELPSRFVEDYKTSSIFCGKEGRFQLHAVGCGKSGLYTTDAHVFVHCPMDLERPLLEFKKQREQIKTEDLSEDSPAEQQSRPCLDCLLPSGIPFDEGVLKLSFAQKDKTLFSCFQQGKITYRVEMKEGALPVINGFQEDLPPLAFTLLPEETSRLSSSMEKYVLDEERVALLNHQGFLGFASPKEEHAAVATNIAVHLPEGYVGLLDLKGMANILKLGGVQRFYLGRNAWRAQVGAMKFLLGVAEVPTWELEEAKIQTLNIRKQGVGDLLIDNAQQIAEDNASKLNNF